MKPELINPMLEDTAKSVLKKVNRIFVFGSTNKPSKEKANRQFYLLLKAISILFLSTDAKVVNKRNALLQDPDLKKQYDQMLIGSQVVSAMRFNTLSFFKANEQVIQIAPKEFTNPALFEILSHFYGPEKFSWTSDHLQNIPAIFSEYVHHFTFESHMKDPSYRDSKKISQRLERDTIFSSLFEAAHTFQTSEERTFFLFQTLSDLSETAYTYGYGNCGMMADAAFIEAINRNLTCPVTYIRFINSKNPKMEPTNAIALGDWPKPGCLIISPWEEHQQYYWEGSTGTTPETTHYNQVKIIFSFKPNDPDREVLLQKLRESGCSSWFKRPDRINTLALVKKCIAGLETAMEETGYLPKSEAPQIISNENRNEIPRPSSPPR